MTLFLAIWGAVVSTVAILWNIRRDLVDRGSLRVICYFGNLRGGPGPRDPNTYLVYHVTNTGRRPVVVTHIGGAITDDKHFMITTRHEMPRTLQPGEYFLEYSPDLSVLDERPKALWAIDSLGKYWKVSHRQLRRLIQERKSKLEVRAG